MIAMGILFGVMLDTYQRFLKRSHRRRWLVFLNDLLFWFIQGVLIFYVLFLVNDGELRFYLLLALICGFATYQALFKYIYLALLEQLIKMVLAMIRFIWRTIHLLIYQPIKGLYLLIIATLLFIGKTLLALVKVVWKMLKWIITITSQVFSWPFRMIYTFVPKRMKRNVEKVCNLFVGFLTFIQNTIFKGIAIIKKFFLKK